VKESKLVFGFFQAQYYLFILLYFDNMYRLTDHHQPISTKLWTKWDPVEIIFLEYGIP